MNKVNYDLVMQNIIKNLNYKPSLLLHSCCAPCSSSVLEKLLENFDVTVYYYNPNIHPMEEYEKRKNEQIRFLKSLNVNFLEGDYLVNEYFDIAKGLEQEKEGGYRCYKCYELRIKKTALIAKEKHFDYFCTTLSVSPHKNSTYINEIGKKIEEEIGVKFLFSDFKKRNGYLRSLELSKQHNFYRQDYCGCVYARSKEENNF